MHWLSSDSSGQSILELHLLAKGMQEPVLQVKVSMGQEDIVKEIIVPGGFKQIPAPGPRQFLIFCNFT